MIQVKFYVILYFEVFFSLFVLRKMWPEKNVKDLIKSSFLPSSHQKNVKVSD